MSRAFVDGRCCVMSWSARHNTTPIQNSAQLKKPKNQLSCVVNCGKGCVVTRELSHYTTQHPQSNSDGPMSIF